MPADLVDHDEQSRVELAGLDALELAVNPRSSRFRRALSATWPKVAAVALALLVWELTVRSGWKPKWALASPGDAFSELRDQWDKGLLFDATQMTMKRALSNYALAIVIGVVVGTIVASSKIVRSAFGSFITGLQTMPSVAWFPLAMLLFGVTESAIAFVVILGAAPSIANGLLAGIDNMPPLYKRAGRVLGAKGVSMYRHILMPAAVPHFIAGLKQGWAFAWRSLMAGELIVIIPGHQSIGALMQNARDINDSAGLLASMIVILVIGIVIDAVFFANLERAVRRRWGLEG